MNANNEITINTDLNPTKEYIFQTELSGQTLPMTVEHFLKFSSHAQEEIITVTEHNQDKPKHIWSKFDGWDVLAYSSLVCCFIAFIDKSQDVNYEFLDSAIGDNLSVATAVATWFEGTEISVEIEQHLGGESGLLDIDIQGIGTVRRVVLSMSIEKSDMFNIYYGESSKGGGTWDSDLITTLKNYFKS